MGRGRDREALRRGALTAFLDERVREGYRVETRTDTHAIIGAGPASLAPPSSPQAEFVPTPGRLRRS